MFSLTCDFINLSFSQHVSAPRYEKLPDNAKFVVLFRRPAEVFWTRYRRYCNSSWTSYAEISPGQISVELYAAGMFAHKAGNEAGEQEENCGVDGVVTLGG